MQTIKSVQVITAALVGAFLLQDMTLRVARLVGVCLCVRVQEGLCDLSKESARVQPPQKHWMGDQSLPQLHHMCGTSSVLNVATLGIVLFLHISTLNPPVGYCHRPY